MQIVYHLGAHFTDEDRLVRSLLKNRGKLAAEGIIVPGPSRYRQILKDTVKSLRGAEASAETQQVILDAVMDDSSATRLVLSNDYFIGTIDGAIGGGMIYPQAGERAAGLAAIFPDAPVAFHLGIRNPATWLPCIFAKLKSVTVEEVAAGSNLMSLRWSETIRRIRASNPDAPLTVWCNEDTPLIWPDIVAAVTAHSAEAQLSDMYDLVSEIMSPEGSKRMRLYLANHPPQTEMQRRRIVSAFLDKFGLIDKIEIELDLPGWTVDFVEEMTDHYEDDIADIQAMEGINFIAP